MLNRLCKYGLRHRLIKTQIGHARDFAWYRGQRPSPARVILSHERVQIHARENLCSYATNPPHFSVRELLLCDILITRAWDGRWPRYQAESLACPGCGLRPFINGPGQNPYSGKYVHPVNTCKFARIGPKSGLFVNLLNFEPNSCKNWKLKNLRYEIKFDKSIFFNTVRVMQRECQC